MNYKLKSTSHYQPRNQSRAYEYKDLRKTNNVFRLSHKGFGMVESITAAAILGITITIITLLTTMLENSRQRIMLRNAMGQVIQQDIDQIKYELFKHLYVPKTQVKSSCYKTNSNCSGGSSATFFSSSAKCRNIATTITTLPFGTTLLPLSKKTHRLFGGKPITIERTISAHKPDIVNPSNIVRPRNVLAVKAVDTSIIRVKYELTSNIQAGLEANSARELIRYIDLNPGSHSWCEPE